MLENHGKLHCLITALLLIGCTEIKTTALVKHNSTLRYNVDVNFFNEVDTSNFQYLYETNRKANFYYKYYIGIFYKSTQSCLYCVIDTTNHVITPFPVWSCKVNFSNVSNIIVVYQDSLEIKYQWDEKNLKFLILNKK